MRPFQGKLRAPVPGLVLTPFGTKQETGFATTMVRDDIVLEATLNESVCAINEVIVMLAGAFVSFDPVRLPCIAGGS